MKPDMQTNEPLVVGGTGTVIMAATVLAAIILVAGMAFLSCAPEAAL